MGQEREDEWGRRMTPKEAFREFSWKFHGKKPGKMKMEKRMRQAEDEMRLKGMAGVSLNLISIILISRIPRHSAYARNFRISL